jgi:hypothetical protein
MGGSFFVRLAHISAFTRFRLVLLDSMTGIGFAAGGEARAAACKGSPARLLKV